MPVYKMTISTVTSTEPTIRLVDAKNPAGAIQHVVADSIKVEKVSTREATDLVSQGVIVEDAGVYPTPAEIPSSTAAETV